MKQSVDAAQIYERTVVGKSHYRTFYDIANLQLVPDFFHSLFFFFCKNDLVGEYSSASLLIHSGHSDRKLLTDKLFRVFNIFVGKLGQRNKSGYFFICRNYATIHLLNHFHVNDRFVFKRFNNFIPVFIHF